MVLGPDTRPPGLLRASASDFRVVELPLYPPSGTGGHVFVTFEKEGLATDEAVRRLAGRLGVAPRDVGFAGMKDRHAVTEQTVSFPLPRDLDSADAVRARLEGTSPQIRILGAALHEHKLRTGHLAGNRFEVIVRGLTRDGAALAASRIVALAGGGVPHAYGAQRFGARGDNGTRALAWLRGEAPPPRDPKARRFQFSALQSMAFNAVLAERVKGGTWNTPLDGDLLQKEPHGALFPCTDAEVDRPRAARGEVSVTGPMFGARMRATSGAVAMLEARHRDAIFGPDFDFERIRTLGEGTRRPLRTLVHDASAVVEEGCDAPYGNNGSPNGYAVRAKFVLPSGAYATTLLSQAFMLYEPAEPLPTATFHDTEAPDSVS